jgi:hypothetical protein
LFVFSTRGRQCERRFYAESYATELARPYDDAMIIGFFLQIFYVFITFVFGILPSTPFPFQISSGIVTIGQLINAFSFLFPVGTLFTVLGLALVFHGAFLAWRVAHWLINVVRGR